jgi:DNA-binding MarR family transcriptional regulator
MQVNAATATTSRTSSVESVMHALMSIGRLIRQRSQGETLDTGSFWLLKTLSTNGAMRVTDLAACANLDPSTVSRQVAQLHRAGLIERTPDPDDRRAQRVQASGFGLRQLDTALRARLAVLERTLDSWGPADVRELDRLLTRFVRDIDTLTENLEKKS